MEALTIWIGVFVAVFAARYTRLTPVLYFLAVGAIMVNTGILPVESHPFIRGFSEVGIIVIMFALGFEENTAVFMESVKRSWGIAFFGALFPFLATYIIALQIWDVSSSRSVLLKNATIDRAVIDSTLITETLPEVGRLCTWICRSVLKRMSSGRAGGADSRLNHLYGVQELSA